MSTNEFLEFKPNANIKSKVCEFCNEFQRLGVCNSLVCEYKHNVWDKVSLVDMEEE